VVRVYDLLLESKLEMCGETILPIEHQLIGMPGARRERFAGSCLASDGAGAMRAIFFESPQLKRVPAEDTAGSVREMMERGDRQFGPSLDTGRRGITAR